MILHATFSDFILFLFVHISHADNNYDPVEIATIKAKMVHLFSEGTDVEKKLYRAIREYHAFDKTELRNLFEDTFQHFSGQKQVGTNLYADLYEIVQADGKVDQAEAKELEILKGIIDKHTKTSI